MGKPTDAAASSSARPFFASPSGQPFIVTNLLSGNLFKPTQKVSAIKCCLFVLLLFEYIKILKNRRRANQSANNREALPFFRHIFIFPLSLIFLLHCRLRIRNFPQPIRLNESHGNLHRILPTAWLSLWIFQQKGECFSSLP